jgi:predicted phosphodiesterase
MSEKMIVDCSPPYMSTLPEPSVAHRILTPEETPKRLIVVGDLHGCLDELQELLINCNYQLPDTKVLIVGDVVNKGPKSAETLRFVKDNNFLCIRGNHDDFILATIMNLIPELKMTEGLKFINQLSS